MRFRSGEQMKAVVLAVALCGCWHCSGAGEQQPSQQAESSVPSDAWRDARGRADAGMVDADDGDGIVDETGIQAAGGSLGGPGGPGRSGGLKGSGRPGPGWRRAPVDAGVVVAAVDAGVMVVGPGCVTGRTIGRSIQGSELVLTIAVGSGRGVAGSWTVTLPWRPRASVQIVRVDKLITVVKIFGVTLDDVDWA